MGDCVFLGLKSKASFEGMDRGFWRRCVFFLSLAIEWSSFCVFGVFLSLLLHFFVESLRKLNQVRTKSGIRQNGRCVHQVQRRNAR